MAVINEDALMSASPYMKAADQAGFSKIVKIKAAGDDDVTWPDGKQETIYFIDIGASKPIKLSKTNLRTLVGLFGNDTADWEGNQVMLATREYNMDSGVQVGWVVSKAPDMSGPDDDIPF